MNLENIGEILKDQPKYRVTQAMKAVYDELVSDWDETSTLPKDLRAQLNEACPLAIEAEITKGKASSKALVTLADGANVETVLMQHKKTIAVSSSFAMDMGETGPMAGRRNTVCVSTQVGCPMGCLFCATGKQGFKRNLSAEEMLEQVLLFARLLKKQDQRVTNVVFMGMGEPFLNYEEVIKAVALIHDKFGLGARRMSISTCGIVPGIKRLAKERFEVNLAISLHAPNDFIRTKLMPANITYSLQDVMKALDYYVEQTNRQVMYEYIMLDGVNDSPKEARELIALLKDRLAVVNLIPYNGKEFKPSSREKREQFKKILGAGHIRVIERAGYGQEIEGACGMLAGKSKKAR
jgi:23S rRNA (adenine2503-C2)-methyltransferase